MRFWKRCRSAQDHDPISGQAGFAQ